MRFALVAAVALTTLAAPAFAEDLTFTVINNSSVTITEMYMAMHSSDSWEENILDGVIEPGATADVLIADGESTCDYDMRFVGDNGATHEVNQNICELATYTLTD